MIPTPAYIPSAECRYTSGVSSLPPSSTVSSSSSDPDETLASFFSSSLFLPEALLILMATFVLNLVHETMLKRNDEKLTDAPEGRA